MTPAPASRRAALCLGIALALALAGCKKVERCRRCGMKIDPASAWTTELVAEGGAVTRFDTPKCALVSWKSGSVTAKSIRAQEYYERRWRDGTELRFMVGGDVVGPMGPDLVPVDPSRATKFIQDHSAERALRLDEITPEALGRP